MVNYSYQMDYSSISKYPEIITQILDCMKDHFNYEVCPLKIDMKIPIPARYGDLYPKQDSESFLSLIKYFITMLVEGRTVFGGHYEEKNSQMCFMAHYCTAGKKPHIQIGGINGNLSISIRSMTGMKEEEQRALIDKISFIVEPYLEKK